MEKQTKALIDDEFNRKTWEIIRLAKRLFPKSPPIPMGTIFTTTIGRLLNNNYYIRQSFKKFPARCVYVIFSEMNEPLYVGATSVGIHSRIRQHMQQRIMEILNLRRREIIGERLVKEGKTGIVMIVKKIEIGILPQLDRNAGRCSH